jgi:hypothetical protein
MFPIKKRKQQNVRDKRQIFVIIRTAERPVSLVPQGKPNH